MPTESNSPKSPFRPNMQGGKSSPKGREKSSKATAPNYFSFMRKQPKTEIPFLPMSASSKKIPQEKGQIEELIEEEIKK